MKLHRIPEDKLDNYYQLCNALTDAYSRLDSVDIDDIDSVIKHFQIIQSNAQKCPKLFAMIMLYSTMYDNNLFDLTIDHVDLSIEGIIKTLSTEEKIEMHAKLSQQIKEQNQNRETLNETKNWINKNNGLEVLVTKVSPEKVEFTMLFSWGDEYQTWQIEDFLNSHYPSDNQCEE